MNQVSIQNTATSLSPETSSQFRFAAKEFARSLDDRSLFGDVVTKSSQAEFRTAALFFGALAITSILADWLIDHHASRASIQAWATIADIVVTILMGALLFYFVGRGVRGMAREVARLRVIYESTSDPILLSDSKTHTFIDVNAAACKMLGYTRDELIGMTIVDISSAPSTSCHAEISERNADSQLGVVQIFEWLSKAKGGRCFWTEVSLRVVPMEERMVTIAILRDISKRKAAEEKAVENSRLFKALFLNTDTAIADLDVSPLFTKIQALKHKNIPNLHAYIRENKDLAAELPDLVHTNARNPAASRLFATPSTVTPAERREIKENNRGTILDLADAMIDGETTLRRESELVSYGGARISVLNCMAVPATEEDARRIPCVTIDLRNVKLAEAARQASEAKSQFLASMSHEIRTPLNGVIGNLELLTFMSPTHEQFELIEQADKAAKSLMALIGNILDFSKIEQGKLAIEVSDVNPAGIVEEAVAVLQTQARHKNIFVTAAFDQDVPEIISSDSVRLRQILLNLIGNAVKFTDCGSVAARVSVAHWDGQRCELKFAVSDSGRGFAQARAAMLFEAFVQDKVAIDTSEGTGLGLSICQKLVEAMGGAMGCEGVPEEGATFWFTLPVEVVKRAPQLPPVDLRNTRLAVVARNVSGVQPLKDYFRVRGASVTRVDTFADALATLAAANGETPKCHAILMRAADALPQEVLDLRAKHIIPILYGSDGSFQATRLALRAGFASVISIAEGPSHLDRNINAVLGRVQTQTTDNVSTQSEAAPTASLQGKRILVLEDRLVNQLIIQKQLAKFQVQFTVAGDGLLGLAALKQQDFDLILCDCSMPNMNGYDFTRTVRAREIADGGAQHIPIIALTANAFREDVEKCHEAGMDDFISKPVNLDRLGEALGKWLNPIRFAPESTAKDRGKECSAIDLNVLVELLGADDQDILNEILAEFAIAARKSCESLQMAIANGRLNGIQVTAHGAKGEARSAGALILGDLYAEVERRAKAGDFSGFSGIAADIANEMEQVDAFIKQRLQRPKAATGEVHDAATLS